MMLALLCFTAFAEPVAYYERTYVERNARDEGHRLPLIEAIEVHGLDGLSRVTLTQGNKTTVVHPGGALEEQPIVVLEALSLITDPEFRGAEWDQVIRASGREWAATLRWSPGDSWEIVLGPGLRAPPNKGIGAAEITRRYGIGPLEESGADWSPEARFALDQALGSLSAAERAPLKDLPVVRYVVPPDGPTVGHAAQYSMSVARTELRVFDLALLDARGDFVGPVTAPKRVGAWSITHEVGHAIAVHQLRLASTDYVRREDAYNTAVDTYNTAVTTYNAAVDRVNSMPAGAEQAAAYEEAMRLQEAQREAGATVNRLVSELDRLQPKVEALRLDPPVVRAYRAVLGEHPGPTRYSAVHPMESFAEAFALFKLDPEALRRIHPGVLAWFEGGGHIEAMGQTQ